MEKSKKKQKILVKKGKIIDLDITAAGKRFDIIVEEGGVVNINVNDKKGAFYD